MRPAWYPCPDLGPHREHEHTQGPGGYFYRCPGVKTGDGAAVAAAQSMGGSLPPAVPSSPAAGESGVSGEDLGVRVSAAPPADSSALRGPGPALIGGQPGPAQEDIGGEVTPNPRRFLLYRHTDISHVSGVGLVAWGVEFPDGSVAIRWHGAHPSTVAWASVEDAIAIHGHSGATEIQWLDGKAGDQ